MQNILVYVPISEESFATKSVCLLFSFNKNHEGGDNDITLQ